MELRNEKFCFLFLVKRKNVFYQCTFFLLDVNSVKLGFSYETLRKYPTVIGNLRICTNDYTIPGSNLRIKKGQKIYIPIYSIQQDPENFENPEQFNPERFNATNKHKIKKGAFIPFGDGPRICLGMRFALYEIRVALCQMVLHYKFHPHPNSKAPLKFCSTTLFLVPESGSVWLRAEKRS